MSAKGADTSPSPECQHQGSSPRCFHPTQALTFSDAMVTACNLLQEIKITSCLSLLTQLGWGKAYLLKPMRTGPCPQICAPDTQTQPGRFKPLNCSQLYVRPHGPCCSSSPGVRTHQHALRSGRHLGTWLLPLAFCSE